MKTKLKKKPNKAYGTPARLRPEAVKLVNSLDRRKKNKQGDVISFSEKVIDLLNELKKWRSGGVESK